MYEVKELITKIDKVLNIESSAFPQPRSKYQSPKSNDNWKNTYNSNAFGGGGFDFGKSINTDAGFYKP